MMKPETKEQKPQRKKVRLNYRRMMREYDEFTSDSSKVWRAPKGSTKIRFMMLPEGSMWYVANKEIYVPTVDGKNKYFVSPRSSDPEAFCPAEEAAMLLIKAGKKEMAQQIRPKYAFFSNVMVRERDEWKYKIYKYPQTVLKGLLLAESEEVDEDALSEDGFLEGGGIIGDSENGRVVIVKKEENKGRTEYQVHVSGKPFPLEKDWTDKCSNLEEFLIPNDPKEIEEAICDWLGIEDLDEIPSLGDTSSTPRKEQEEFLEEDEDESPVGKKDAPWDEENEEEDSSKKQKKPLATHASRTGRTVRKFRR